MNDFEAKRQRRAERYQERADRAAQEAQESFNQARQMGEAIPLGQPILVGHHSEKRDRRYRQRIDQTFLRGVETQKKAEYWQQRAEAALSNTAISSDDPDALNKLQDKLSLLEEWQERMKEINVLIRRAKLLADTENLANRLQAFGLANNEIVVLAWNLKGLGAPNKPAFLPWQLSNNGANIRAIKVRIEQLQQAQMDSTTERTVGEVRLVDNVEDNRFQLFFNAKPSQEVRQLLKSYGFRWTPTVGCWQAMRSNKARYWGEQIAHSIGT